MGFARHVTFRQSIAISSLFYSLLVLVGLNALFRLPHASVPPPAADFVTQPKIHEQYGKLPMHFEANHGQLPNDVRFLARGAGYALTLGVTDAQLHLGRGERAATVTLKLLGANPQPHVSGAGELPGKSNYLIGSDTKQWQTDVPTYAKVRYENVYEGIDAVYYGQQEKLECDFIVAPGADPQRIRLQFEGASALRLDDNGDLLLQTAHGEIRQQRPVVYQDTAQGRQPVAGSYVLAGEREVGFALGDYDAEKTLVIDPVLAYSTYFGGSGQEFVKGIAVDSAGNAYIAGYTSSADLPVSSGAWRTTKSKLADVFVMKLNATGTALVYSTYLGGHVDGFCCPVINTDGGRGVDIVVDALGNAYVAGYTFLRDFPVTPNAAQPVSGSNCSVSPFGGNCSDAFVTKLNANGSALVYSTFLGGGNYDAATGIALDAAGNAYVTGYTLSSDFPRIPNAPLPPPSNIGGRVFVAKVNASGTAFTYATDGGGIGIPYGVAVDAGGNAYIAGQIFSPSNTFVSKINPTGTTWVYTKTLAPGPSSTTTFDLAVDGAGNAYVAGVTNDRNFPTTPNAFQRSFGSQPSANYVLKLSPDGGTLLYSTLLDLGELYGIAIDTNGYAWVTGTSRSPTFPVTADALTTARVGMFITRLSPNGSSVEFSTFLGEGVGYGVATDVQGNVYVTGQVHSNFLFPTTMGAVQTRHGGGELDLFVAKLSGFTNPQPTAVASASAASYVTDLARGSIVAAFGAGLTALTQTANAIPLPLYLGGVSIRVRDSAGIERRTPLFFASPGQVNYQLPAETSVGTATMTVERGGVDIATQRLSVVSVSPGLFAANATGRDVAAALVLRINAFGRVTFEPVARFDAQLGRYVSLPLDLGPEGDQVFLALFGTGIRNRSGLSTVSALIGGATAEVTYAGAQLDFAGLDQVNMRLPRSLTGRGEVDIALTVDGKAANAVRVNIK